LGSANDGGGTDGQEFTFPDVPATAGEFIYVSFEGNHEHDHNDVARADNDHHHVARTSA
jgi:hypothetical protein